MDAPKTSNADELQAQSQTDSLELRPAIRPAIRPALRELVLRLADDHLILGHRLSEWCGHAPMLEEDLSLPNMALDLLGQAQVLFEYIVELDKAIGPGKAAYAFGRQLTCADDYAFLRTDREYVNCLMVERPNSDFAHTMLRQLYFSAFMLPYWTAQKKSADTQLAAIADKAEKEISYHLRHSAEWVIRLGDGTEESARRMAQAVERLHLYTGELFINDDTRHSCVTENLVPALTEIEQQWSATIKDVFAAAELVLPENPPALAGGRKGRHTEDFGFLLADLQYMQRAYPGAQW